MRAPPASYRLTQAAEADYDTILRDTLERFGVRQFEVYRRTLNAAIATVAETPERTGSKARDDLGKGVRTFHASLVTDRRKGARHIVVYRVAGDDIVEILRLLYDGMELRQHVPV